MGDVIYLESDVEEGDGCPCPHCEEMKNPTSFNYIHDRRENWCGDCSWTDAWQCDGSGNHYSIDEDWIEAPDGQWWCQEYADKQETVTI